MCICCILDSLPKISLSDFSDFIVAVTSIAALFISIHTIKRENILRQKDEQQRIKQQEKEDKIKKWNALYPHRLKFYTDFYDTLFQFVYYSGSNIEKISKNEIMGAENKITRTLKISDIVRFCSLFNMFNEEAKVLFSPKIQEETHKIYQLVKDFIDCPIKGKRKSLSEYAYILENKIIFPDYKNIEDNLRDIQKQIQDFKLADSLRYEFQKSLKLGGDV